MIIFKKLTLQQRLPLQLMILLLISYLSLGIGVYIFQRYTAVNYIDTEMNGKLEELKNIINIQQQQKQNNINLAINLANELFKEKVLIDESDSLLISFPAINQITKQSHIAYVPQWTVEGEVLQKNYSFVDFVKKSGIETATIFQKIPEGYLRISTNVENIDGTRAIGTYIPNNSPVVQTIETSKSYRGLAFVVNKWYLTAYEPFKIKNEIKGMLYVGIEAFSYTALKKIFNQISYYGSGYPSLITKEGIAFIHPNLEGLDLSTFNFYKNLDDAYKNQQNKFFYTNEADEGVEEIVYFYFYEELNCYICTTVKLSDVYKQTREILSIVFIGLIISLFITAFAVIWLITPITLSIKTLTHCINEISVGNNFFAPSYKRNDEIKKIYNSIELLVNNLSEKQFFADNIKNGNYNTELKLLGQNDQLGKALIEMRNSLREANKIEEKRKFEDAQKDWITGGIAKFGEILRMETADIENFAFNIIRNLVEYVDANQGGFFIFSQSAENSGIIEQAATFAYNRKRKIIKQIEFGEGLISRSIELRKTIHLTEIPDDYIQIKSGLGSKEPNSLLIVPIITDNNPLGAIEIASFKNFTPLQIEFVEKLASNIAAVLTNVRNTLKTKELLEQSKQQTVELQAREEELQQNLEELRTTQEAAAGRENLLLEKMEELKLLENELKEKEIFQNENSINLQKEYEEKIFSLENKFKLMKEVIKEVEQPIATINQHYIIINCNKAFQKLVSVEAKNLKNISIFNLFSEENYNKLETFFIHHNKENISEEETFQLKISDKFLQSVKLKILKHFNINSEITIYFAPIDIQANTTEQIDLIEWNEEIQLNIKDIDNQHKYWISLINKIYSLLKSGEKAENMVHLFDDMLKYTGVHFKFEEENMQKFGFKDFERHKMLHNAFRERVKKFRISFEQGQEQIVYEFLAFLNSWVKIHITKFDKEYEAIFRENGL